MSARKTSWCHVSIPVKLTAVYPAARSRQWRTFSHNTWALQLKSNHALLLDVSTYDLTRVSKSSFFKLLLHESYKNTPVRVKKTKQKQKEKDWNAQKISPSLHFLHDLHSQKTARQTDTAWTFTFTGSRPQLLSSGLKSYWTVEGGGGVSHGIKCHTLKKRKRIISCIRLLWPNYIFGTLFQSL